MSRPDRLTAPRALVLGTLHGPAELLPISSSAHMTLVPYLLGWEDADRDADPELRKAFEVALHAGTALALLVGLRDELASAIRGMTPALGGRLVVASVPAALVGLTLEKPIERRLGTPETIALGMILGALALGWADRSARERSCIDARIGDALWLGIAQACALMPGVSRHGATLAAARRRRFARADANRLSRQVALPVIGGAAGLKTLRLAQRGLPDGMAAPFALGAAASFGSTLLATRLLRVVERDASLAPYAVYRLLIAGAVLRRARRGRRAGGRSA